VLISKNGIHAGVVRDCSKAGAAAAPSSKRCKLGEIPLDVAIHVRINGELVEAPLLSELQVHKDA